MCSEVGHQVSWVWNHLGVYPVQAKVSTCFYQARGCWLWELQCDLWLVASYTGLGVAWEHLNCELRPAATCAELVATEMKQCSRPRVAASLGQP